MPSTRDIRRRIKSVKNTAQITKAMQMVAASKMRKAQQAALAGRPLRATDEQGPGRAVAAEIAGRHPSLHGTARGRRAGASFSSAPTRACAAASTATSCARRPSLTPSTVFIAAGRKGSQFLARTKRRMVAEFTYKDAPLFAEARAISKFAGDLFLKGEVDRVEIVFTNFISTLVQKPEVRQLLPIGEVGPVQSRHGRGARAACCRARPVEFLFEPSQEQVLAALAAAQPEFSDLPDSARSQGQRAQRPHGRHEKRHRQRQSIHQGPHPRSTTNCARPTSPRNSSKSPAPPWP